MPALASPWAKFDFALVFMIGTVRSLGLAGAGIAGAGRSQRLCRDFEAPIRAPVKGVIGFL